MLKRFPKAYAKEGLMSGDWYVFKGQYGSSPISSGRTAKEAWEAAADFYDLVK